MSFEPEQLRVEFLRHGVRTAGELARAAKVSQPTVARALKSLGEAVIRLGKARASRYVMRAPQGELGTSWPLYLIGLDGVPEQLGHLHSLLGGRYWLERGSNRWPALADEAFPDEVYPDLPWFLDDYRPQGFLGRAFARAHAAALRQEENPRGWDGRVVVEAMLRFGEDFPGAFVLGREGLAQSLATRPAMVRHEERGVAYPALAERLMAGDLIGSSAGGEQPKFVVEKEEGGRIRHVLVKFSPKRGEPGGERWADLLLAEHLAGTILSENGFTAARSEIVEAGERRFLEVERFDRVEGGGRRPVISLNAMAGVLEGTGRPWPETADELRQRGWLTEADAEQLASLWRIGRLIANTDMHDGNASLLFTPEKPVELAPVYDMLPMAYRPNAAGEAPRGASAVPLGAAKSLPATERERSIAETYWKTLAEAEKLSETFREIARAHVAAARG